MLRSSMAAARMAYRAGDFNLCAKHYKKSIEIAESNGLDDAITGEALIYLSICCSTRREFREAETLLNTALSNNEADPQCDKVLLALTYHELSVLYWKTERESQSRAMNAKALVALEQAQSGIGELKVMVLRQKAVLLAASHDFKKADAVLDIAMDICLRSSELGKNSLAYGETLITKVLVCIDSGRLEEARELYFQAIQITEMCLGLHHPKMADLYDIFAKHVKGSTSDETSQLFCKKSKEIRDWIKHTKW
ncbi:hypothetical protein BH10CYA1_BH10CYA1_46290 [soil metagenome]